jgi:hypothetical protein
MMLVYDASSLLTRVSKLLLLFRSITKKQAVNCIRNVYPVSIIIIFITPNYTSCLLRDSVSFIIFPVATYKNSSSVLCTDSTLYTRPGYCRTPSLLRAGRHVCSEGGVLRQYSGFERDSSPGRLSVLPPSTTYVVLFSPPIEGRGTVYLICALLSLVSTENAQRQRFMVRCFSTTTACCRSANLLDNLQNSSRVARLSPEARESDS